MPHEQFEFGFLSEFRRRPKFPERLFYSVFPDAETASRIGEFAEWLMYKHRIQGKRLKEERLHVSLRHVGDYKRLRSKFVYAAVQAGNTIASDPFGVSFNSVTSFETPPMAAGKYRHRPAVLLGESEDLRKLNGSLADAMIRLGLKAGSSFIPHMTMYYGARCCPNCPSNHSGLRWTRSLLCTANVDFRNTR